MVPPPVCNESLRTRMAEVASRQRAIWLADEVSPLITPMSRYDDRTDPVLVEGQGRYRFADKLMPIG
eukprot:14657142-Alexandrium_andersonii.AAC.1